VVLAADARALLKMDGPGKTVIGEDLANDIVTGHLMVVQGSP
jgi:hypothetical protein